MFGTINRQLPALLHDRQVQKQVAGSIGLLTGLGATVAGYSIFREPLDIQLDELTMRIPNAGGRLPEKGLRILHLSDTHFQGIEWREQAKIKRILQLTAGLEYDLLIHTGDFWHNDAGLTNILRLLGNMPKPRLGSFGVLGNHDYTCYSHSDVLTRNWEHFQALENGSNGHSPNGHTLNGNGNDAVNGTPRPLTFARDCVQFVNYFLNMPFELARVSFNDTPRLVQELAAQDFTVLINRAQRVVHNPSAPDGVDFYIAGVDDVNEGQADVRAALADVPQEATTILLSHHPDILMDVGYEQAEVLLAGHTHGGQIVLPVLGPVHTHSRHLRRLEVAGVIHRGNTQVYVSRGIGEGIPLRFGARPQITLITLYPEN